MAILVPENITVHLGAPNASARNVTVPFTEYIKNVASSEIYPTWPENAIRANIYAQISYTLNRIYTEYYRSRGYDFDITNTTQFDHAFVEGREIFDTISRITDDIFNDYIVRNGNVEPLFAQFCDGVRTQCDGLSQWGSVELAEQGLTPYEILQNYYGNNINLVFNAPVGDNIPSYPGLPLRRGTFSEDVRTIKRQLNRIGRNYPAIPQINDLSAAYDLETENAVREFQRIFNLTPDGVVGKSTWYKIKQIYTGVKGLSELVSEGLTISETQREYPEVIQYGDSGIGVSTVQYYLAFLGYFIPQLPRIAITGEFNEDTRDAVYAFQDYTGLSVTGIVDRNTWNNLLQLYNLLIANLPENYRQFVSEIYPGRFIVPGDSGDSITTIQENLRRISEYDGSIPLVTVTGTYDEETQNAVRALQAQLGIPQTGVIGPVLWSEIITRGNGFE